MRWFNVLLWVVVVLPTSRATAQEAVGSKVSFDEAGVAQVNGKPFFPVGLYTYHIDREVVAQLHELQINTVVAGFQPQDLGLIHEHGLMALPYSTPEFLEAAKDHPALLAWYLVDEPENGTSPQAVKEAYARLKETDPHHPIGLCHFLFEALTTYKDGCDFTMTDVYPVTANRDVPLVNVGFHIDEARRVHGPDWPHWAYIQIFGGPETDGGKWAQPLPHEVRCMAFIALVHRATGILYFSYWPKAPQTWAAVAELNKDLHRLIPWLVADGEERAATSGDPRVQVRAKKVGEGWMVLAVNTSPQFCDTTIQVEGLGQVELRLPFENREVKAEGDSFVERFGPYREHVYLVGSDPQ